MQTLLSSAVFEKMLNGTFETFEESKSDSHGKIKA